MKKNFSLICILLLVTFGTCGPCGTGGIGRTGRIPEPSFDYKTTSELIEQQADPVDLTEIISGGPLYVLDPDSENPTLRAYRRLRLKRVNEMKEMMKEERDMLEDTLDEMPEYRSMLLGFLGNLAESLDVTDVDQAKLKTYALDTMDRYIAAAAKTTIIAANLEALGETLDKAKNEQGPVMPMLEYSQYALLNSLIETISHELSYFPARTVGIVMFIKENEKKLNRKTRKINKKYDKRVEDFLEDIQEPFQEAILTHLDLSVGFQSLEAADYAFVMAFLDFAEQAVPRIEQAVGNIRTGDVITDEDKSFYETYALFIKKYTETIREEFENVEEPRYLKQVHASNVVIPPFGIRYAHAGFRDWLDKTASSLTSTLKGAGKAVYGSTTGCVKSPWQCTKKAFKNTQKVIGATVDTVNIAVGTGMDVAAGVYYGNSLKDTSDIISKNINITLKAWEEGAMGATVLKDARDYLEAAEKGVGKVTAGIVEKTWGKGYLSWGAGKLGEITTNMVTGFGKGALALSNPKSTNAELIEGAIDVAFSLTGGSKSVVKGGQTLKGTRKLSTELAKKSGQQLERLSLKLETWSLMKKSSKILMKGARKKLAEAEKKIFLDKAKRMAANEVKEKLIKETEKKLGKILGESLEQGGKTIWGNLKKEVPDVFQTVVKKSYKNSVTGYKKAAKDIFGKSLAEWGDNVIGNRVDDVLKKLIIPMVAPEDKAIIDKSESEAAPFAGVDLENADVKNALDEAMDIIEDAAGQMVLVNQAAEQVADETVKLELLKTVEETAEEVEKEELSKPVKASGSFSGDYSGDLTLEFTPGGGPLSGKVTTQYGSGSISGTVSKNGRISAHVSGKLKYEDYEKKGENWVGVWKDCTLDANMNGSVRNGSAFGSYSGSCAKENDSGTWSASW